MGHKKHSSRKSKHSNSHNHHHSVNNNNLSSPEPNLEIPSPAVDPTSNTNTNTTSKSASAVAPRPTTGTSLDVNQYLYDFISSEEFNNCYPIIAFQSSVLLTCVELLDQKQKEDDQNMKIPVRELLINAEKRIKDWEERARTAL